MSKGELKSYDVTLAFCKRAAIAQQLINCCTEIMFEEALVRAKECDEFLKKEGRVMGTLHGLPISLKVRNICVPLQDIYLQYEKSNWEDRNNEDGSYGGVTVQCC